MDTLSRTGARSSKESGAWNKANLVFAWNELLTTSLQRHMVAQCADYHKAKGAFRAAEQGCGSENSFPIAGFLPFCVLSLRRHTIDDHSIRQARSSHIEGFLVVGTQEGKSVASFHLDEKFTSHYCSLGQQAIRAINLIWTHVRDIEQS